MNSSTKLLLCAQILVLLLHDGSCQRSSSRRNHFDGAESNQIDCSDQRRVEVGHCVLPGQLFGYESLASPANSSQLVQLCFQMKNAVSCGLQYTHQCLKGVSAQISSLLLRSGKNIIRARCGSRIERKEFMDHLKCFEDPVAAKPIHDCMAAEVLKLDFLARNSDIDPDYLLPGMCCTVPSLNACVKQRALEVCQGRSSDPAESADYLAEIIAENTRDVLSVFCGKFANQDTCAAELPQLTKAFAQLDLKVAAGSYRKLVTGNSIALPLLDIFARPDF